MKRLFAATPAAAAVLGLFVVLLASRGGQAVSGCEPISGIYLAQLRSGMLATGIANTSQCVANLGGLLAPGNSTQFTRLYDPVRGLALGVSQCSALAIEGQNLIRQITLCNCSTAKDLPICQSTCIETNIRSAQSFISKLADGACNSSALTMPAVSLQFTVNFAAFVVSLLQSVRAVNNVTMRLTALTAGSSSTLESVRTTSLASPQSVLLVCAAMFPVCSNGSGGGMQRVPLCRPVCARVQPVIQAFSLFANISKVPIGALLAETFALCAGSNASAESPCLTAGTGGVFPSSNANQSAPTRSGLCLSLECPYPMRSTAVEKHWNPGLQALIRRVHGAVTEGLPDSRIPFNGSVLPCGADCVAVGFSDTDVKVSRIFLSLFSTLTVVVVIASITVFFFNRKRLGRRLVRRVLVIFTFTGGIASISFIPAAYNNHDAILCERDGTLRLSEPGPGDPRCTMGALFAYLFVTIATGYFVALAHSWFVLIGALDKPNLRRNKTSIDIFYRVYRFDIAYAVCTLSPPLVLSIVLLALKGIDANVLNGVCSASVSRNYYVTFYVVYFCVTLLLGVVFLLLGLKRLAKQKRGITGLVNWVKLRGRTATLIKSRRGRKPTESSAEPPTSPTREPKFSGMARHDRKLRKEINQLAFQILGYILIAVLNVICTVILGIYLGVQNSKWKEEIEQHIFCMITSCQRDQCPPLPTLQPAVVVTPLILQFSSLTFIAAWPFSAEYLVNVPLVRWLFRDGRDRADTGVSSSTHDSADTPQGSRHVMTLLSAGDQTPDESPESSRRNGSQARLHPNGSAPLPHQPSPLAQRHTPPMPASPLIASIDHLTQDVDHLSNSERPENFIETDL